MLFAQIQTFSFMSMRRVHFNIRLYCEMTFVYPAPPRWFFAALACAQYEVVLVSILRATIHSSENLSLSAVGSREVRVWSLANKLNALFQCALSMSLSLSRVQCVCFYNVFFFCFGARISVVFVTPMLM